MISVSARARALFLTAACALCALSFFLVYLADRVFGSVFLLYFTAFLNRGVLFAVPLFGASFLIGKPEKRGRRCLLLFLPRLCGKWPDYYLYFMGNGYYSSEALLLGAGQALLESALLGGGLFLLLKFSERFAEKKCGRASFSAEGISPFDVTAPLPLALLLLCGIPAAGEILFAVGDILLLASEGYGTVETADLLYFIFSLLLTLLLLVLIPVLSFAAGRKYNQTANKKGLTL